MDEAVFGADPRHAVHVELDPVADAEFLGVEGAVLGRACSSGKWR